MKHLLSLVTLSLCFTWLVASAHEAQTQAQAPQKAARAAPPAQRPVTKLVLQKDPDFKQGKAVAVKGSVDQAGHRFVIDDVDVLQPVGVMLFANDKSHDLQLEIMKYEWTKPARESTTKGEGYAKVLFRTQGSFLVLVKSPTPETLPFGLIVWVGDEQDVEMPGALVPSKRGPAAGGGHE